MSDQEPAQRLVVNLAQEPCTGNSASVILWLFSFVLCIPEGLILIDRPCQQEPKD